MAFSFERRTRQERRQRDAGAPAGCYERRRRTERRLPEAAEVFLSDSDWEKLFGGMAKAPSANTDALDGAADVLARAVNR